MKQKFMIRSLVLVLASLTAYLAMGFGTGSSAQSHAAQSQIDIASNSPADGPTNQSATLDLPQSGRPMIYADFGKGPLQVRVATGNSNNVYTLERSTDLLHWTPVAEPVLGSNQSIFVQDSKPLPSNCFYRVRVGTLPETPTAPPDGPSSKARSGSAISPMVTAVSFVQLKESSARTSSKSINTGNFNSQVSSGNLIITWVSYNSTSQSVSSVTDNKGNNYVKAVGPTTGSGALSGWRQELWYARNVVGGSALSVSANFNATFNAQKSITAHEYSGLDPASPLDATSAAVTSSANASTPAVSISVPNELIFGAALMQGTANAGSGFIKRSSLNGDISEDKSVTAAGSYAATFSNTAQSAIVQIATFKAAGSTVDTAPPTVPSGLSARGVSASEIDLTWTASTDNVGVTGYNIYRNNNQIGTSSAASFADTGLAPSTSYTYAVAAFDAAGNI